NSQTSVIINQIYSNNSLNSYEIQRNSKDEIYISIENSTHLAKVINPDSYGFSSVDPTNIYLGGNTSKMGLPQLIPQHTGCISDIILTTPETNNNYIYQAGSTITTQNNYSINNQNISMKAGDAIVLFPNTEIRNNSLFLAKIENCPLSKPLESYHNTPINLSYNLEQSELKVQKVLVYPNPATSFFIIETEKLEKWE